MVVPSRWVRGVAASLAWAGLTCGTAVGAAPPHSTAQETAERIVTVQDLGKPGQKCRVLRSWRMTDGSQAYEVQSLESGEFMTVVESGPPTTLPGPRPGTRVQMRATRIYHWGRHDTPPPGAPTPPGHVEEFITDAGAERPEKTAAKAPVKSTTTYAPTARPRVANPPRPVPADVERVDSAPVRPTAPAQPAEEVRPATGHYAPVVPGPRLAAQPQPVYPQGVPPTPGHVGMPARPPHEEYVPPPPLPAAPVVIPNQPPPRMIPVDRGPAPLPVPPPLQVPHVLTETTPPPMAPAPVSQAPRPVLESLPPSPPRPIVPEVTTAPPPPVVMPTPAAVWSAPTEQPPVIQRPHVPELPPAPPPVVQPVSAPPSPAPLPPPRPESPRVEVAPAVPTLSLPVDIAPAAPPHVETPPAPLPAVVIPNHPPKHGETPSAPPRVEPPRPVETPKVTVTAPSTPVDPPKVDVPATPKPVEPPKVEIPAPPKPIEVPKVEVVPEAPKVEPPASPPRIETPVNPYLPLPSREEPKPVPRAPVELPPTAPQAPALPPTIVVPARAEPVRPAPLPEVARPLPAAPPAVDVTPPVPPEPPRPTLPAVPSAATLDATTVNLHLGKLRDGDLPSERERAAEALLSVNLGQHPHVAEALLTAARNDPAPTVRVCSLRCLVKLGVKTPATRAVAEALAKDGDIRVQSEAEWALRQMAGGK